MCIDAKSWNSESAVVPDSISGRLRSGIDDYRYAIGTQISARLPPIRLIGSAQAGHYVQLEGSVELSAFRVRRGIAVAVFFCRGRYGPVRSVRQRIRQEF